MKLLLSACACEPRGGSEGIYGWYVISALAKEHECYILTSRGNQGQIEEAAAQGLVPQSMHFRYIGTDKPYPENRMHARILSWINYRVFCRESLEVARAWHKEVGFDVAQHVTYTTWRIASPLWKLGIPFIWGPISGTEVFPRIAFQSLSFQAKVFEIIRSLQTAFARRNTSVRDCAKYAFQIPAPHQQAVRFLAELKGTASGVSLCHNFFFPDSRMDALARTPTPSSTHAPLRAFGAGNLEGRKGVSIALLAIAMAKARGITVEYQITSKGPELAYLKSLSMKLGISDHVRLGLRFEESDFAAALSTFDICLLPSLRDGAGLSIMEAMLAGCVPIVADWCGPAEFVTEQCGYKVPVSKPFKMAQDICDILCKLHHDRDLVSILGHQASMRIRSAYNETQFLQQMNTFYQDAMGIA